ncbi:hypothetical protein SORBI_3010G150700 [Sorghum bicolor]|uniref:PABC domain-containing protein n=1 Tax=Sorghum bicolor TaxID=4558 RepID=A0A194YJE1_SORBI|nr:hypothetical protein SORBI_3010G150700 [Sorghum bicolor]KXG20069.1 hypothetical protein SORBI_3010G150700 [Sorghum bicolor]
MLTQVTTTRRLRSHELEREQAAKVTVVLLEMDQMEVLHLLELPDALRQWLLKPWSMRHTGWATQQHL